MLGVVRVRASRGGGALDYWTYFERRQRGEVRALAARSAKDIRVRGTSHYRILPRTGAHKEEMPTFAEVGSHF
jgi:hypothetical protein